MHPFVSMTIRFSFTGAVPVTRNRMPLFLEKTSFFSLYRTLMVSRIQRKTEKEVIFSRLESSLKFLHYAQKLQSMIRCFFQSFHLLFGMSRESFHKKDKGYRLRSRLLPDRNVWYLPDGQSRNADQYIR